MKRRGREFWTWLVDELERSAEPCAAFARQWGVHPATLRSWRNRLRPQSTEAAPRMVAVHVVPADIASAAPLSPAEVGLEVVLPGGLHLRFGPAVAPAYVLEILGGLGALPC